MSNTSNDSDGGVSSTSSLLTTTESATDVLYVNLLNWVTRAASPVLLTFGTIGNILQLIVLTRTCAGTSVALLLRSIAVGNIADLWFYVFYIWMQAQFNIDLRSLSTASCKILPFISYASTNSTILFGVCATFDRLIAVWFPLKMKAWCNLRVAWAQIVITFLIGSLINFPTPFVRNLKKGACSSTDPNNPLNFIQVNYVSWVVLGMISIAPETLVILFNVLLVVGLSRHSRRIQAMRGGQTKGESSGGTTLVLTLGMSILFVVFYTPILVYRPLEQYFPDANQVAFIERVFSVLQHTHHTIDFYVYLFISASFRSKCSKALCCK